MQLSLEIIGLTFSTMGEILLAVAVISVHHKVKKEHRIDSRVINEITAEELVTILAVVLIIAGYILQVDFFRAFLG